MEKVSLKHHRFFSKHIYKIICYSKKIFFYKNNVRGFFFNIRGKLGVSGNSKKRKYSFVIGKISRTKKNLRMLTEQSTIRTKTGVLGFRIVLTY